jgi:DNA repair exonuclease SbcCD ATPase subunit
MASESSDETQVSVSLPPELQRWVTGKATELDVEEEEVIVQFLAAYRATEEFEDEMEPEEFFDVEVAMDGVDIESEVRSVITSRLPSIAEAVEERLDTAGGDAEEVGEELSMQLDRLETDVDGKIQDVRERVIQVKREADAKAPTDHDHPEFDRLQQLGEELDGLEANLDALEAELRSEFASDEDLTMVIDRLESFSGVNSRLDEVEERLQTLAWVVSDLRDSHEALTSGTRAIDRLKKAAAQADIGRAVCENCQEPVEIGLLTEPKCPHCETTVSDVEPSSGFLGKPQLIVAKQLAAGNEVGDEQENVPDAAKRGDDA